MTITEGGPPRWATVNDWFGDPDTSATRPHPSSGEAAPPEPVEPADDDRDDQAPTRVELPWAIEAEWTDFDNGARFADAHVATHRYVPEWDKWLHWDGKRWAKPSRTGNSGAMRSFGVYATGLRSLISEYAAAEEERLADVAAAVRLAVPGLPAGVKALTGRVTAERDTARGEALRLLSTQDPPPPTFPTADRRSEHGSEAPSTKEKWDEAWRRGVAAAHRPAADYQTLLRAKQGVWKLLNTRGMSSALAQLSDSENRGPLTASSSEFDTNGWLLNVANGTIDLSATHLHANDAVLRPYAPDDHITHLVKTPYDPAALCPTWDRFLIEATSGDADKADYLQRAVGLTLIGVVTDHVLLNLVGGGNDGKSVFIEVIAGLLGNDLAVASPSSLLMESRSGQDDNTAITDLQGRRMSILSETSGSMKLNEASFKRFTGGDRLTGRRMRQDYETFVSSHTFWMLSNEQVRVVGTDHGLWRRIKVVPFNNRVAEDRVDTALKSKLAAERPGILAWAVRGAMKVMRDGGRLLPCAAVIEATEKYRTECDVIGGFLDEFVEEDTAALTLAADLYQAYRGWCVRDGLHPMTANSFGRKLTERGYSTSTERKGTARQRKGLRLRPEAQALRDPF